MIVANRRTLIASIAFIDMMSRLGVSSDPHQENDIAGQNHAAEDQMRDLLVQALNELQAPTSQFQRLGLD